MLWCVAGSHEIFSLIFSKILTKRIKIIFFEIKILEFTTVMLNHNFVNIKFEVIWHSLIYMVNHIIYQMVSTIFWLASIEDPCQLPHQVGRCRARLQRWYYNAETKECQLFTYGGCGGNANNFRDRKECFTRCMPKGTACKLH